MVLYLIHDIYCTLGFTDYWNFTYYMYYIIYNNHYYYNILCYISARSIGSIGKLRAARTY